MRKRNFILFISILLITALVTYAGEKKYNYPDRAEIQLKVNYLSRIIKAPFAKDSDLQRIKDESPEWLLFTLSFSTFALTNIGYLDTAFKKQAIDVIDWAIQKTMSDTVYNSFFPGKNPLYPGIDSTGSVLYFGHLNMMLGCYRLLSSNQKYNALNDSLSKHIYTRMKTSTTFCLPSYEGMIWIPDNTAALASLELHSQNSGSNYRDICSEWVTHARHHFTSEPTGVLYSTIDPISGEVLEKPRGSMLGWTIFFIYRFDKNYANELYENYKTNFSGNLFLFRLYKERYQNREINDGDIDSGPLFLGYSIPANVFAFGDAVAMKDLRNAQRMKRLITIGCKLTYQNNEIKYNTRFINLQVSPLAESILLYMETMTEWK